MNYVRLAVMLLLILSIGRPSMGAARVAGDLPHTTLVVWDTDEWTVEKLSGLRSLGVQGVSKIVGASAWNVVERTEGQFDFSRLESFLDRAQRAGLWALPTVGLNMPPKWFVERFPSCLMRDSAGNTVVTYYSPDDGQVLNPWFMAGGFGDRYIRRYVDRLMDVLSRHPNVIGVFLGNEAAWIFNRPWKLGDSAELDRFACFDAYCLADYKRTFGARYPQYPEPPKTLAELESRSPAFGEDFDRWYQAAAMRAIDRYLGWVDKRVKYKVVNVGFLGSQRHNRILGNTRGQIKAVFAMMARHRNVIENFEALDTSVCGEVASMASDAGLIFGGEPVGGGDLPAALAHLRAGNGRFMAWIAFEEGLAKLKNEIADYNNSFPAIAPPRHSD